VTGLTSEESRPATQLRAKWAVELINHHIHLLRHPNGAVIRLVQFSHDSPGLRVYKRQVCEALVNLVESNGGHIFNGLDQAVDALRQAGYTVLAPTPNDGAQSSTEPL
jgi:hypothetical protein